MSDINNDILEEQMKESVDEALDKALPIPSEKQAPGQEAPASATVHAWNRDNFGVLFTIRDTDAKSLFARMGNFLKVLKAEGWKPDWKNDAPTTQKAVVGQPTPSQDISGKFQMTCPIHGNSTKFLQGTSKKTGKPYSFWSCQMKDANGDWCKAELTKPV